MVSARNLVVLFAACLAGGQLLRRMPNRLPTLRWPPNQPFPNQPTRRSRPKLGVMSTWRARCIAKPSKSYEKAPQNSAVIWNKIGIAYHQMTQLDAAMKRYRRAIRLDAKYSEAINNLGTVYYAEKHYGRATSSYKRALKLAPGSASIYSNLGTAYFAEKRYKQAWEAYNTAFQLDPEVFEHRNTYGVLLQERTVEERARFHYYLAKIYAKQGQTDRALQYIRKALEEGFTDRKKLLQDPEFAALRDLPAFKELLKLEPRVL